jgi:hypothetical protein
MWANDVFDHRARNRFALFSATSERFAASAKVSHLYAGGGCTRNFF